MEPAPPSHDGFGSPPRLPLRGGALALRADGGKDADPLIHQQPSPRRHLIKHSPRHVKLQSVNFTTQNVPQYATSMLGDQNPRQFWNELFQLHQILNDTLAAQSRSTIQSQINLFHSLTSDHSATVLREFFSRWQQLLQHSLRRSGDEEDLLSQLVGLLFRCLPVVLTESEVHNAKSFVRYMDTMKAMRELILALVFKPHSVASIHESRHDHHRSIGPQQPQTERPMPLYLYCQELEHEVDSLRRKLGNLRMMHHPRKREDTVIGLMNDQTVALLLEFWELPKAERIAFFCQVASQAKSDDCSSVLRVFLEKCSTDHLVSVWDALQITPNVQHALAVRKHGGDVEAAAKAAAEALAVATHEEDERKAKLENEDDGDSSDDEGDDNRRGKTHKRSGGHHRLSHRQVDIGGLDGYLNEEDRDEDEDDGNDDWMKGGKRRRRRIRIREPGRTPEGHRGHHSRGHREKEKKRHGHGHSGESSVAAESHASSKPNTPKPILERVHSVVLELLKDDHAPGLDAATSDAAWKLIEAIDHSKKPVRKLSTFQAHAAPLPSLGHQPAHLKHAATVAPVSPGQRQLLEDPLGMNLTTEQQYTMKLDQLQSLLVTLSGFSVHAMSTDTITSAFKRTAQLTKLFHEVAGKAISAAGHDSSPHYGQLHTLPGRLPSHSAPPAELAAPLWADDVVIDSVETMLGKLGKMVRSLAPIADASSGGKAEASAASMEILKLAEAMEEAASAVAPTDGKQHGHRGLSLDHSKRLAVLGRLKALAQSNQIDALTGILTTTCEDIVTLQSVARHQQQQLESAGDARLLMDVEDGGEDGEEDGSGGGVDDVLKSIKKAKIRRASAAKTQATGSRDDSEMDDGGGENDEDELLMNPMTAPRYANRDIPLTIKQATAQRGSKLFNVGILLRVVDQMYREHYETMLSSLQYGSRRMEFSEFMYDWHIRKYGLKTLAQQHLLKLIQSLRKYERKSPPCCLCLRFLGIVSPLGYHEHKFVLGLLDKWSGGSFSSGAKHRVEYAPRQFKLRIAYAVATIQEALTDRFGVYFRSGDAVGSRVKALAMRHDDEFAKEADVLHVAIEEWQTQRQRLEQILAAVYAAGDLNGDGSLEYDEFNAVMTHLAPAVTDKFVHRVFAAAHDFMKPRRISFARFVDVVLLERVLGSSSSARSGRGAVERGAATDKGGAATSTAGDATPSSRAATEDDEAYQFKLLERAWETDKETVAQVLGSLTHAPTVATIQFRVTFLTQILGKRVDAKTAWLCHRQIMREISRYQHLNEAQIVQVKTKEESFRKAVLAIRNLHRLSGSLHSPPPPPATATVDENTPPPMVKQSSYVSVVESTAAETDGGRSLADLEALEDQLRLRFLEQADESAIDDFKVALQTIRRLSVQAMPTDLELAQLRAEREQQRERRSMTAFDGVAEGDDEDASDDEDVDDDDDDCEDQDDGDAAQ